MTTTAKKATSARIAATSPLLNAGSILSSTKRFSREKLYLAAVAESLQGRRGWDQSLGL
jgi:hypothetical protein